MYVPQDCLTNIKFGHTMTDFCFFQWYRNLLIFRACMLVKNWFSLLNKPLENMEHLIVFVKRATDLFHIIQIGICSFMMWNFYLHDFYRPEWNLQILWTILWFESWDPRRKIYGYFPRSIINFERLIYFVGRPFYESEQSPTLSTSL